MDAVITALIALMPLFATAPLAIGAVAIVAILASPRLREALGEWARRRLGVGDGARNDSRDGSGQRAVAELHAQLQHLGQRVEFLERMLVEAPHGRAAALLPAPEMATPRHS